MQEIAKEASAAKTYCLYPISIPLHNPHHSLQISRVLNPGAFPRLRHDFLLAREFGGVADRRRKTIDLGQVRVIFTARERPEALREFETGGALRPLVPQSLGTILEAPLESVSLQREAALELERTGSFTGLGYFVLALRSVRASADDQRSKPQTGKNMTKSHL